MVINLFLYLEVRTNTNGFCGKSPSIPFSTVRDHHHDQDTVSSKAQPQIFETISRKKETQSSFSVIIIEKITPLPLDPSAGDVSISL
jgi:hypothetical protein